MDEITKQESVTPSLGELRYSNSLLDLIWASFLQYTSGFMLGLFSVLIALNAYFRIYTKVDTSDPMVPLLLIFRYISIYFLVIIIFDVVYKIYQNMSGKLNGIIGEHEFSFYEKEFVEKTSYNESHCNYNNISSFYGLPGYYILKYGAAYYVIPKRDLSGSQREMFERIISRRKKLKFFLTPFVVMIVVLSCFVFYQVNLSKKQYTFMTMPTPFTVKSSGEDVFVISGRQIIRTSFTYGELIGVRNSESSDVSEDPRKNMKYERTLWVTSQEGLKKIELPDDLKPQQIFLHEGSTYLIAMNDTEAEMLPQLMKWMGGEMIKMDVSVKNFMRNVYQKRSESDEDEDSQDNDMTILNEYEYDRRSEGNEFAKVQAGEGFYHIYLKNNKDFDPRKLSKYVLSGEWPGGRKDIFADFMIGQVPVNKKRYNEFKVE